MVGFPTTLNTKADYEYVRENFPVEKWKPAYQDLLNTMHEWYNTGAILEIGVTDDIHRVVIDEQKNTKYQYEKRINENCKLLRIGYTEEEVKAIIAKA